MVFLFKITMLTFHTLLHDNHARLCQLYLGVDEYMCFGPRFLLGKKDFSWQDVGLLPEGGTMKHIFKKNIEKG